jgi:putative transposase
VVNYRKQLLIGDLGQFIKDSTLEISEVSDFSVEEIEIDKDHIHILMRISPKYSVSQHVRNIKQMTTSRIWRAFPALKKQFWLERNFWSDGYFVCSVGNASSEAIRKYIQEQG